MSIYLPVINYFRANWLFKGNYRLSENILYELSEEGVVSNGETFNGQYSWDKVYRVKVLKNWLLIYQSRTTANLIKVSESDIENIESLKKFLKSNNFRLKRNW
ncbi:MAG: YcxB family protein [Mucilaginibacter sp.]